MLINDKKSLNVHATQLYCSYLQVLFLIASCFAVPLPPGLGKNYIIGPKGFGSSDPYTNKTIDQLITGALGGIGRKLSLNVYYSLLKVKLQFTLTFLNILK